MSGRASGSSKRRHHDEDHDEGHEGSERWLVTYADMVTLLMVLFIVMFAMSTVDQKKYNALKNGLSDGFGRSSQILNGASPMLDDSGPVNPSTASYDMLVKEFPQEEREKVSQVLQEADKLRNQRKYGEAKVEVERLDAIWAKIDKALRKKGLRDDVRATIDERGLVVSLVSQHVVFQPDVAVLTTRGQRVVDTMAPVLKALTEPIELDGHTTQERVQPKYYPTDWELSLARAANVLRRLEGVAGVASNRLRATGFGHTKPLIDPTKAGSRRVNKRVDIVVLSQAPAETKALMAEVYDDLHHSTTDQDTVAAGESDSQSGATALEEHQP